MGLSVALQWVVERGLGRVGVRGTCVGGGWGEGGKEEGGSEAAALGYLGGGARIRTTTSVCVCTACALRSCCINTRDQRITTTHQTAFCHALARRQLIPLHHHWLLRIVTFHDSSLSYTVPSFPLLSHPDTSTFTVGMRMCCSFVCCMKKPTRPDLPIRACTSIRRKKLLQTIPRLYMFSR